MNVVRFSRFVSLAACCVVMAGCRGPKGSSSDFDDEFLDPSELPVRMESRFDDGERITNVSFPGVSFGYDNYQINPSESRKIEAVAQYMRENRTVRLITEGHCDERGSREYNMSLGEHRAQAVRAYAISLGIDGGRIQTRSYGEENPIDPGHHEGAWRLNRRVEFALYR